MLRKRPSTSMTLLAWTVVKTRWPVNADWIAIDREILEKYSWKMPEDLRDGFRARVTASK